MCVCVCVCEELICQQTEIEQYYNNGFIGEDIPSSLLI